MKAVFLPGFLCDERVWQNQVAELPTSFQTEVLDFRYCKNLDEMLSKVADIAWDQFHLLGFSMGGYVAQVFAATYPERIQSLCLVATSGTKLTDKEIAGRLRMESVLKVANYKGISPKEMYRYVHPSALDKPEITDLIIDMSATNSSEMYLNQMHATLHRENYTEDLQNADYPISILGGAEDPVASPEELKAFASLVPRAEFQLFESCGHYVPLEKPQELTEAIKDFILDSENI